MIFEGKSLIFGQLLYTQKKGEQLGLIGKYGPRGKVFEVSR